MPNVRKEYDLLFVRDIDIADKDNEAEQDSFHLFLSA